MRIFNVFEELAPPWLQDIREVKILPTLPGCDGKNDEDEDIRRAAYNQIRALDPSITIYSDGSSSEGMSKGGAAAVICRGSPERPSIVETLQWKRALHIIL